MRRSCPWCILASCVAAFLTQPLEAQDRWRFDLVMDNDFFVEFAPTRVRDYEYTHGTVLSVRRLGSTPPCGSGRALSLSLAQRVYTPRDESPDAVGQRTHAGWLRAVARCGPATAASGTSIGVAVGVVGPEAGGAEAQRAVHALFHFREPRGWDTQLRTRLDAAAAASGRWKLKDVGVFQLWTAAHAVLGTIRSSAGVEAAVSLQSRRQVDTGLDVRLGGTMVGNDYLLQGVNPRRAVAWANLRGRVGLHPFALSYGLTARTRAYAEEPSGFLFGSIGFGIYR